ncbi:MAG: hypothetical protein SOW92_04940 [Kiritimatiellia bacterium]|nr:hypothetical protein [Kiritimatiellia bacterium]
MKYLMCVIAVAFSCLSAIGAEADAAVTQADLKALIERIAKLEAENKAQAQKIAELEGKVVKPAASPKADDASAPARVAEEGTKVSESGKVYTTAQGYSYYLADKLAGIFEPLSESGLKITPYGWLAFEAAYNSRATDCDWTTDVVKKRGGRTSTLSMQDSILGMRFETPEKVNGWKISGKGEFDFAGGDQNSYDFHWRHLYFDATHDSGWSVLFGQTWHLWKMVAPSEIDGAWLENTGYPYRRSPQIRVTKKWKWEDSSLEARVGIVKGGPGMGGDRDGDGIQDNSSSAWPLVQGALVYDRKAAWEESDRRWLVGIGGMYGRDRSHRMMDDGEGNPVYNGTDDEYDSKMIMLAASVPFLDKFTLTGQIFAGDNLGGIQGGIGQRVAYREMGQKGREVSTIGGFVDLSYAFNDRLTIAGGYGFDDPTDSEAEHAGGLLYNDRAYVNAIFKILHNFRVGLEYARLNTKYSDVGNRDDDRIQFSAWYDF